MSDFFDETISYLKTQGRNFTILKLALTSPDNELINSYQEQITKHNENIRSNLYSNAGFDLFVPDDYIIQPYGMVMVSMNVKCEMIDSNGFPSAFYMYPRSSISKTPLYLANSVGIIDSGYRGNLIGAFRSTSTQGYRLEKNSRVVQITNSTLTPILVKMVDESELSTTERGSGGFGSTGV